MKGELKKQKETRNDNENVLKEAKATKKDMEGRIMKFEEERKDLKQKDSELKDINENLKEELDARERELVLYKDGNNVRIKANEDLRFLLISGKPFHSVTAIWSWSVTSSTARSISSKPSHRSLAPAPRS